MKGMEENLIITYSGFRVSGYYTHNGESKREEHENSAISGLYRDVREWKTNEITVLLEIKVYYRDPFLY